MPGAVTEDVLNHLILGEALKNIFSYLIYFDLTVIYTNYNIIFPIT